MLHAHAHGPARRRTARTVRVTRLLTAAALTCALGVGTLPAAAGTAQAAALPATTVSTVGASAPLAAKVKSRSVKAKITVKVTNKEFKKGAKKSKSPLLTVAVTSKGRTVKGAVRFYTGGKQYVVKLRGGKASFRVPSGLSVGTHKVGLKLLPSDRTLAATYRTVDVRSYGYESKILVTAAKYVGTPYRYGGSAPGGFDCSGFTSYVYRKAGVKNLPRTANAQRYAGRVVSRKNARPGDLIWTPGHVAIYAGGNTQIDAARTGTRIKFRKIWQSNPTFIHVSSGANGL